MGIRLLPKVRMKGGKKVYYFDERLSQLRNVKDPYDHIDLESDERDAIEYMAGQPVEVGEKMPEMKVVDLPFREADLAMRISERERKLHS